MNGVAEEQFVTSLALDRAGHLQSLGYPTCTGGSCGGGGSAGRTVSFVHAKGFLSKIPGFVDIPVTYHANGMLSEVRHSNGMKIVQGIDTTTMMRRPYFVNMFDSGGAALSYSGTYEYDGAGNIKELSPDKAYRYDGVSRLVESREKWGATTHVQKPTFDAYGNIQSLETGPSGSLTTLATPTSSSTNRLTTAGTTYDLAGNMTQWASGPLYDYDRLNRMRRFRGSSAPGAEQWVFGYTADDERVLSLRVGGSGEIWSLRGLDGQVLREIRADVSIHSLRDYVWTGRNLVAKVERTPSGGSWTETRVHVGTDHLGTVRTLTDQSGLPLPGHIYFPFGQELTTSADTERMKYTGHERDLWNTTSPADDLDYMHARHYNPQLGRFLQVDPLKGSIRRPQSLNRYAYVLGNPLNFVDPRGLYTAYVVAKDPCSEPVEWSCPFTGTTTVPPIVTLPPKTDGPPGVGPASDGPGEESGDEKEEDDEESEDCAELSEAQQRYIASWNEYDSHLNELLAAAGQGGSTLQGVATAVAWGSVAGVAGVGGYSYGAGSAIMGWANPYLAQAGAWASPSAQALFASGTGVLNQSNRWLRIGFSDGNFSIRGRLADWFVNQSHGAHIDLVTNIKTIGQRACKK